MKLVRYQDPSGQTSFGCRHDDGHFTRIEGDILGEFHESGETVEPAKLLAPLMPCDILCIGLNYRKHAAEGNHAIPEYPVLFMKNLGAVQNPGDPIILPRRLPSDAVDYECELAVVIGRECYNVSKSNALDYVLGYTCANDVSARKPPVFLQPGDNVTIEIGSIGSLSNPVVAEK